MPSCSATERKAATSLGKQEPPYPMPGRRNLGPMRLSRPMPRATCSTFASVASQRFETALMNEIFSARKAFEACLMISALLVEVNRSGGGSATLQEPGDGAASLVVVAAGEGKIDAAEHGRGAFAVRTDDDAVGMQEVADGRSFPEEFGVGDDVEELAGDAIALHRACYPFIGVDGNGALFDDDFVTGDGACDLAGDGFDVGEIGVAGLTLGGADGDKDGFALPGGLGEIGHEADFGVAVFLQEFGERVFVDERVASLKSGYLSLVIVHANDVVAHFCKTDGGYKSDISRSDDGNFDVFTHGALVLFLILEDNRMLELSRMSLGNPGSFGPVH